MRTIYRYVLHRTEFRQKSRVRRVCRTKHELLVNIHERLSDNYFQNFDNPPTNAILGLYKLDDELNIVESYEHYIPIDTTESVINDPWISMMPNENCGRLYLFTSFIDNSGAIVGSFFKCPTLHSPNQAENDSMFFFKMNFDLLMGKYNKR